MKKLGLMIALTCLTASSSLFADWRDNDLTSTIPVLEEELEGFQKIPDVAHYKMADWKNVVGVKKNMTVSRAVRYAKKHPEITYFFYVKGGRMILENETGYRRFDQGDAVFFTGTPWWGSAPDLADGYIKN